MAAFSVNTPDGLSWSERYSPHMVNVWAMAYSPELELFAAASYNDYARILTSNNGSDWTLSVKGDAAGQYPKGWRDITWGGAFVAVGDRGALLSYDGRNWTKLNIPEYQYTSVCFNDTDNSFILMSRAGVGIHLSLNADKSVTIGSFTIPAAHWTSVAFSPSLGKFVAVAYGGGSIESTDGSTWTTGSIAKNTWSKIMWISSINQFVAVANAKENSIATSATGATWTYETIGEGGYWRDMAWAPALNRLMIVSSAMMTNNHSAGSTGTFNYATRRLASIQWSPKDSLFIAQIVSYPFVESNEYYNVLIGGIQPTPTPSVTPTITITPSITVSVSPLVSPTATPSPTVTPTPSLSMGNVGIVSAGTDTSSLCSTVVPLVGSISGGSGGNLTILWEQISGPAVVINDPSALSTYFTYSTSSDRTFRLWVNKGSANQAFDDVTVFGTPSDYVTYVSASPTTFAIYGDLFAVPPYAIINDYDGDFGGTFSLTWKLKPLDNPTAPYTAKVSVEQDINGVWTEIYTTDQYLSTFYIVPVPSSGRFRVKASLTSMGRTSNSTSGIVYGPNAFVNGKKLQVPADTANFVSAMAYTGIAYEITRIILKNISYTDDIGMFGSRSYASIPYERISQNLIQQTYSDTAVFLQAEAINTSTSTTITRLNGSSIGNQ